MKALPSIAFSEFTGSAGDVTARSVGGRTLLNHKAYQSKVKTPSQAVSRNTLSKVSRAYKQLTDSQMKAWGALAQHLKGVSVFGKTAELTAHNAFVRLNCNRQLAGLPMLEDAPEYRKDIPVVRQSGIWVTDKRIIITELQNPKSEFLLAVKMSVGQKQSISSGWSKMVLVSPGMEDDWGDAPLTQLYNERLGVMPSVGEKVFVELCWLDPNSGIEGSTERAVCNCITDEEAKEQGLTERLILTNENFRYNQGFDALKVEITGGNAILSTDMPTHYGAGSGSSAIFEYSKIPEELVEGKAYILGRALNASDKYRPQTVRMQVTLNGEYNSRLSGDGMGGYYKSPCDFFGTGIYIRKTE